MALGGDWDIPASAKTEYLCFGKSPTALTEHTAGDEWTRALPLFVFESDPGRCADLSSSVLCSVWTDKCRNGQRRPRYWFEVHYKVDQTKTQS